MDLGECRRKKGASICAEAAELLDRFRPPVAVVLPLPREPLFPDRPFVDTEYLASLLDARRVVVPEGTFHCELGLATLKSKLTIVDPAWALTRMVILPKSVSAHYNPRDRLLYVGRRQSDDSGLYRIDANGNVQDLVKTKNIAGVTVDHRTGDVYYSEDIPGRISRLPLGSVTPELWVSGFAHGNTFPVGMAVAGPQDSGPVLIPGQVLCANHGSQRNRDELYLFSTQRPEQQVELHSDAAGVGPLDKPLDVAIKGRRRVHCGSFSRLDAIGCGRYPGTV